MRISWTSGLIWLLGVLLIPALLLSSMPSATVVEAAGQVSETVLSSGLVLITERRTDSEITGAALAMQAGSRFETQSSRGATHLLSHLYLDGSTTHPSRVSLLSPIFEAGGDLLARPGWESITLQGAIPAAHTDTLIDRMGEMVSRPLLQPEVVRYEQSTIEQELELLEDNPAQVGNRLLLREILGHPDGDLGYPSGAPEGIRSLTLSAVAEHHDRLVGTNRAALAIVSPLDHGSLLERVQTAFSDLGTAEGLPGMSFDPMTASGSSVDAQTEGSRAYVLVGIPIPGTGDSDRPAFDVIAGSLNGLSGRLFTTLRVKQGLVYTSDVRINPIDSPSLALLTIDTSTDSGSVDAVLEVIRGELERLRSEPLSDAELKRAIGMAQGDLDTSTERAVDRATRLAGRALTGNFTPLADYTARIAAVTTDDVLRVAGSFLISSHRYEVVVRT